MKRSASPYAVPITKQGRVIVRSKSVATSDALRLKYPNDLWLEILQHNEASHILRKSSLPINNLSCQIESLQPLRSFSALSSNSKSRYYPSILKSKEDMYDEIIQLKKNVTSVTNENCRLKTKHQKLEDDNLKKSRQIQELLNLLKSQESQLPTKCKQASTLASSGMKQKVLRLEQLLKEKNIAQNKFESDIQVTNIKEMKIQIETFFQEILRLQNLVTTLEKQASNAAAQNELITQIIDSNKLLKEENESLQSQMIEMHAKISNYGELTNKCAKLESIVDHIKNMDQKFLQDGKKIKKIIHKAREERNKFKKDLEDKEKQILALRSEVGILHKTIEVAYKKLKVKEKARLNLKKHINRCKISEQKKSLSENSTRKCNGTKKANSCEKESEETALSFVQNEEKNKKELCRIEDEQILSSEPLNRIRKSFAARTIQREWRKYKKNEEAISLVQSSVKAHLARTKYLLALEDHSEDKQNEENELDKTVTVIQSAIRGHIARTKLVDKLIKNSDSLDKLEFPKK